MSKNIYRIVFKKTKKGNIRAYILGGRLAYGYDRKLPISVDEAEKLILEGKARIVDESKIISRDMLSW